MAVSGQNWIRAAVSSVLLMTGSSLLAAESSRPNVLFIAVDDLKPVLGCYGTEVKTPNIDRLAARGMVFANNHCQQAVCGPTRASLMTGWRPDHTRVWDLKTKMREMNADLVTIPEHFKTQGYTTVSMGKIHDGRCCDGWDTDDIPSWSERVRVPDRYPGKRQAYYADPDRVKDLKEKLPALRAKGVTGPALWKATNNAPPTECVDVPDDMYPDGARALSAVEWVGKLAKEDKPFFLAVGFDRPHLPFVAPKKYWDMYSRDDMPVNPVQQAAQGAPAFAYQDSGELRAAYTGIPDGPISPELQKELIHGYYASVSYIDAGVGLVLDELEKSGAADNTIIVLWGDHGFHLGDHGMFCKHTNYEQATRSPLIISAPNLKPAAAKTNCPTEFVDVFPTLCDLAGITIPGNLEGVSLKPLFAEPEKPVKALAISQYPRGSQDSPIMGYAYRGQRYRYVKWIQKDYQKGQADGPTIAVELYDYQSDPMETRNLADDPAQAATVKQFEEMIASGWQGLRGRGSDGL